LSYNKIILETMNELPGIQYFGNIYYFKILLQTSDIIFDQYEAHRKTSFNNRCLIAGANGPILLSIPLQQGRLQKTILKDIRISKDEKWQQRHWRSIVSSYNPSPWFNHYSDKMAQLFSLPFEFLIDWNLACLEWTLQVLKAGVDYRLNKENELAGPMADYASRKKQDIQHLPDLRYQQVFEDRNGFIPGLSIIDVLFCEGPQRSRSLLTLG
ncbi:MAG: WbqC family protein, partial [Chitinophagaceae bacterium]